MKLLESIIEVFGVNHVPYAVFGGTAVKAYYPQRITNDVDVITLSSALPQLAHAFGLLISKDGFGQDKIGGPGFEIFGDLLIRHTDGFFNFQFDDQMISRLEKVCLDDVFFWTLSREDHIVLKTILQRDRQLGKQDLQDIQILAGSSAIDVAYLNQRIDLTASRGWADEFLVKMKVLGA